VDHFGGRKSEDFAENPLLRISMFTSSRVWSDFGRISQQIRGFKIDYECGLKGVSFVRNIEEILWFQPKDLFDRNITFPPIFRTQDRYIPDICVAEHYG
jgi:hypothetical protein